MEALPQESTMDWASSNLKTAINTSDPSRKSFMNQKGIYVFKNGDVYTGDSKDDLMHGQGRYLYANGKVFWVSLIWVASG